MANYRKMKESDYPYLADMIWKKWANPELKKDPELAEYYGYMVLYSELSESSASFVSEVDGKPVGLLILSIRDGHPTNYDLFRKMMEAGAKLCEIPSGAKAMRDWLNLGIQYSGVAGPIVDEAGLDAEVQLFINDENHRGQGVGSGMLNYMANYLHDQGCKTFFLHTDECSDHDFYPTKRNMHELNRRKSDVDVGDVENCMLYIYYDDVKNQMDL